MMIMINNLMFVEVTKHCDSVSVCWSLCFQSSSQIMKEAILVGSFFPNEKTNKQKMHPSGYY